MAIVTQDLYDEKCRSESISQFSKTFGLAKILGQANIRKAKGVGVLTVLLHMLAVGFSRKSFNQLMNAGELSGKKDVYYRFMNSIHANWSKFIRILSASVIASLLKFSSPQQMGVLIMDDTLNKHDRSKKIELLTRLKDHNDNSYHRGFRCLTLGFHDGLRFVPVDFCLLSSQKEEVRINEACQDLDKRSNGYKIRKNAISNTYQNAYRMINHARGLARYVLFDSWFAEPVMFQTLRTMHLHGIGMLKAHKGRRYRYKGTMYTLEALHTLVKPFLSGKTRYAALGVELKDGTPFSITFVRDKHKKRDWLAIGTTDLSLPPEKVIELYARRWNIEVFFKTVKSCLGFAKECQSRHFDAIVCAVAIVFARHIIMTWLNVGLSAPETDGQLFLRLCQEMTECTLLEAISIVLRELKKGLVEFDSLLDLSLREFIALLPCFFNRLEVFTSCES